jgi:hypothetical protein
MAAKKSGGRRYGPAAGKSVKRAMKKRKSGTLKSGRGGKGGTVKSRAQAIAIGLSEAREKGAKVPARRKSASKKSGAKKSGAKKSSGRKSAAKKSTRKRAGAKRAGAKKSSSKRASSKKTAR